MRISPLPPLPSLIAFEAAVRHSSFTRAATELHLTQSAISRQIAQLERFLGKKLFIRTPRALRLTVGGQRYAEEVQKLLVGCAEVTEDIMKRKGHSELTVACSSGVAVLWLIVNDRLALLSETDFDMGIYFCAMARLPDWPRVVCTMKKCSPSVRRRIWPDARCPRGSRAGDAADAGRRPAPMAVMAELDGAERPGRSSHRTSDSVQSISHFVATGDGRSWHHAGLGDI